MSFLSPWSALIAAAIALPLLLLLYFLKLRRQALRIPSTLLWQKSFEDLQVNAPFQRLRWSLLLLLQFLILLALILALGDPVLRGDAGISRRMVLMIDRSASMNALVERRDDGEPRTRLDAAKEAAREMIDSLGRGNGPEEIMIIAFGRTAQVMSSFESDRRRLADALDSIAPTDEQGDLDAALQLADAFVGSRDESEDNSPPGVMLFSDGTIAPSNEAEGYRLRGGRFTFVQVVPGEEGAAHLEAKNIGITALGARRDSDDPIQAQVFARLINTAHEAIEAVVSLTINGQAHSAVRRTVPAANDDGPGEATITQTIEIPEGATIVVNHNANDDLPSDNTAAIVLPPPARPRIALVHPNDSFRDQFLFDLLDAAEPQRLDLMTADGFIQNQAGDPGLSGRYDLIVFDRVNAERLPSVPSLTVGGVPAPLEIVEPSSEEGRNILSWDRQHPLMRNVSLDTIVYSGFGAYVMPASATALALGRDGPIIATLRTRGVRHVAVGFELLRSNWPLHISSSVFVQNVLENLTFIGSGRDEIVHRPGETISVRVSPEARQITVTGPSSAANVILNVEPGSTVALPALRRVGLYEVTGAAAPTRHIAVSMLSDVESDIRPSSNVNVAADQTARRGGISLGGRPLWPWLVALAFALMVVEWLVYCRRARGR